MPVRIASIQRLRPPPEAVLVRGFMERRDSGILGVTIRSHYVLAANALYEYKVSRLHGYLARAVASHRTAWHG
jgi:hypothetical protein